MSGSEGHEAAASLQALEALLTRSEGWAQRLVRTEAVPVEEFRTGFLELEQTLVQDHIPLWEPLLEEHDAQRVAGAAAPELLRREHRIFPGSLEQLRWFHLLVVRDDHGGNRQALGQYLRIFHEALARHVADESKCLAAWDGPVSPRSGGRP